MTVNSSYRLFVKGLHLEDADLGGPKEWEFCLNPAKPNEDGLDLEQNQAKQWVEAHPQGCKESLNILVEHVEHINFQKFLNALEKSIKDIKVKMDAVYKPATENLNNQERRKFIVLVEPKKSNQWVAELARSYFKVTPQAYYRLGEKGAKVFIKEADNCSSEVHQKDLVLFDDASYSGQQISEHLSNILQVLKKTGSKVNVFVVVPFMTIAARECIDGVLASNKKLASRVFIAEHEKMSSISDILSDGQFKDLKRYYLGLSGKETVTYFSHKMPNFVSFFSGIKDGTVHNTEKITKKRYEIIKEIISPYKGSS
ncbi:MAG: hypothetical protein WCT85_02825 [Parachlamydiales bacterium]